MLSNIYMKVILTGLLLVVAGQSVSAPLVGGGWVVIFIHFGARCSTCFSRVKPS